MSGILVIEDEGGTSTQGMRELGQQEFGISISDPRLLPEGEGFLRFVVEYVSQSGKRIHQERRLLTGTG